MRNQFAILGIAIPAASFVLAVGVFFLNSISSTLASTSVYLEFGLLFVVVTYLLGAVAGLACSIMGLVQLNKKGKHNRLLALGGFLFNVTYIVFNAILYTFLLGR